MTVTVPLTVSPADATARYAVRMKRYSLVLAGMFLFAGCAAGRPSTRREDIRTVYVSDCGRQVEVDQHRNGSLYLKGTDIPYRGGENCG